MLGFVWVIPFAFLLFYLALIFESTGIALLGYAAVAFAVLSFLSLLFTNRLVKIRLDVPARVAEKDQVFGLRMEIEDQSPLPVGRVKAYVSYGEDAGMERQRIVLSAEDLRRGESSETRRLSVSSSGYYEFQLKRYRVYDAFGVFYLSRKGKSIAHVMILPKLEVVPVKLGEAVRNFYGETVDYDENQSGADSSETFGIREFHDGDKLQRIHWKLSARTEELMVKEDSLPKSCAVVLFLSEGILSESKSLDYMASLSFTLTDEKCAHYVAWFSQSRNDVLRARVEDEESFYLALTTYMKDCSAKPVEDRVLRYKEKYKGEQFLHSVSANKEGELWVDEEKVGKIGSFSEELFLR